MRFVLVILSLIAVCYCQDTGGGGTGGGGDTGTGGDTGSGAETTTGVQTVEAVCDSSRTKSMFCNNENNCNADGIILCYGNGIGETLPCPETQKYCSVSDRGDSCSTSPPSSCGGTQSSTFRCTNLGYFPNVADCSSYYFCGLNQALTAFVSTKISCPSGNVFDPRSASLCSRQNAIFNNCITFKCANDLMSLTYTQLSYGTNNQYYTMCVPGEDVNNPRVFVCPNNAQPNLSGFSPTCDYRCYRVGAFENSINKNKFFECFLNDSLRLQSVERNCPPRSEFNASKSQCQAITRSLSENLIDDMK